MPYIITTMHPRPGEPHGDWTEADDNAEAQDVGRAVATIEEARDVSSDEIARSAERYDDEPTSVEMAEAWAESSQQRCGPARGRRHHRPTTGRLHHRRPARGLASTPRVGGTTARQHAQQRASPRCLQPEVRKAMPDTFTLTIELGNDAMSDSNDVAAALHTVASYLRGSGEWDDIDAGNVRDVNGNTVGQWEAK